MDVDDGVEDSLGLASMLRPLIEKLLKEVLRDLLGSSGLERSYWLACLRVGSWLMLP